MGEKFQDTEPWAKYIKLPSEADPEQKDIEKLCADQIRKLIYEEKFTDLKELLKIFHKEGTLKDLRMTLIEEFVSYTMVWGKKQDFVDVRNWFEEYIKGDEVKRKF